MAARPPLLPLGVPSRESVRMQLTEKQLEILAAKGHLLVTGGPGSGKTTVAILKAAQIAERDLRPGQKILFLSFARATVSRIFDAIERSEGHTYELQSLMRIQYDVLC